MADITPSGIRAALNKRGFRSTRQIARSLGLVMIRQRNGNGNGKQSRPANGTEWAMLNRMLDAMVRLRQIRKGRSSIRNDYYSL